jgi:hypothetical protein
MATGHPVTLCSSLLAMKITVFQKALMWMIGWLTGDGFE